MTSTRTHSTNNTTKRLAGGEGETEGGVGWEGEWEGRSNSLPTKTNPSSLPILLLSPPFLYPSTGKKKSSITTKNSRTYGSIDVIMHR